MSPKDFKQSETSHTVLWFSVRSNYKDKKTPLNSQSEMALKNTYRRNVASDGKLEMSLQEFKRWLKRFDTDKDGKISKEELRDAVRSNGGWFSRLKGSRGIKTADANGNGYIDENEFNSLVEFAQRNLGVRIASC
ncbi:hypothetical protein A4A49_00628 [Nicotiana attenuata]|uniref:EF-hand domain-containing protein n=1 Tax=Nicotiana attenuata TaxID=49451 RepID=A0A1J6IEF9_NICAT|nr:hypothetical protein A4A49_00628 [Nicotiana attenuata]